MTRNPAARPSNASSLQKRALRRRVPPVPFICGSSIRRLSWLPHIGPLVILIRLIELEVKMRAHLRSCCTLALLVSISWSCSYGRLFKLRGFAITNSQASERVGEF